MATASSDERRRRRRSDLAYACYLWIAAVLLVSALLDLVLGDASTAEEFASLQGVGMLVILPLAMSALVAAVIGIKASLQQVMLWRRESGLWLLPLLLLVLLGVFLLVESDRLARGWLTLAACIYALAGLVFSLRWFMQRRGLPA